MIRDGFLTDDERRELTALYETAFRQGWSGAPSACDLNRPGFAGGPYS